MITLCPLSPEYWDYEHEVNSRLSYFEYISNISIRNNKQERDFNVAITFDQVTTLGQTGRAERRGHE